MKKIFITFLVCTMLCGNVLAIENLNANSWYYDAVSYADTNGLYDFGNTFTENIPVSTFDAVKAAAIIHSKSKGMEIAENDYVKYAADNGLIDNADIVSNEIAATRGFTAEIFAHLTDNTNKINDIKFIPDISIFSEHKDIVFALYNAGIFTGKDKNGVFDADSILTAEELATICYRISDKANAVKFSLMDTLTLDEILSSYNSLKADADKNIFAKTSTNFEVSEALHRYISTSLGENATTEEIEESIKTFSAFISIANRYEYVIPTESFKTLADEFNEHWNNVQPILQQNSYNISDYAYLTNYWVTIFYQQMFYDYIYSAPANADDLFEKYGSDYVLAKHILIAFDENTEEDKAKTLSEANAVLEKVKTGDDFDSLIKEYGEDPGMVSSPGGYIFTYGEMVEPFEKAAFSLEDNEISELVETDYGYHIIKKLPLTKEIFLADQNFFYNLALMYSKEEFEAIINKEIESIEISYIQKTNTSEN